MSSKQVRHAILTGPRTIEIVQRPAPPLERGEVRIAVEQCGVSETEVRLWAGEARAQFPVELGQEIAGRVIDLARPVVGVEVGDLVAAWAPVAGGMADEAVVKAITCVKITSGRCPAAVHALGRVVNAFKAAGSESASMTVLGAGYPGVLAAQLAQGARTMLVANSELGGSLLARATQARLPIATPEDIGSIVDQVTKGERSEVVFEFTGMQAALDRATRVVRPGGRLVIGGLHQGLADLDPRVILGGGWRVLELERLNRMAVDVVNAAARDGQAVETAQRRARQLLEQRIVDPAALGASTASSDRAVEMLASAVIAVDKALMVEDEDTVVIGSDPRALFAVGLIRAQHDPRRLILATRNRELRKLGRSLGATHVVDPADLVAAGGADCVYEFTGVQESLDLATRVLRTDGKLVIGGLHQGRPTPDGHWSLKPGQRMLNLEWLSRMAVDLVNGHFRDPVVIRQGMKRAAELIHDRTVDPWMGVDRTFPLEETAAAFESATRGILKTFVKP